MGIRTIVRTCVRQKWSDDTGKKASTLLKSINCILRHFTKFDDFGGCKRYPGLMIHFRGINHPEIECDLAHSFRVGRESIGLEARIARGKCVVSIEHCLTNKWRQQECLYESRDCIRTVRWVTEPEISASIQI
ncbi:hypothetical protein [Burkholderia sp. AU6039]|uniref:hypothetical protein n=1 Tax=Burkholderia sp. AU6039 TaxID=2015344 RepID=UPI00117D58B3|nr:hypothetical protein [Burkholderia sp. AU6039]